jgi:hypothetical protein
MKLFTRTSDTTDADRHERVELARAQRLRFAKQASLEELERDDLAFVRSWVVHKPTGDQYTVYRGSIDAGPHHPVTAYYATGDGDIVFLERLAANGSKQPARR